VTASGRGRRAELGLLAALLAWCVAIALADWALAESTVLLGFLSTGPVIAAAFGKPRVAAAVSVWAVALGLVLGEADDIFGTTDHVIRVAIVAAIGVISVWLASTRQGLERARFRDRLVADGVATMTNALDYEVALIELARLATRRLCDWCFVFLREDDGSVRQVAVSHVDPERQRIAWELLVRYPLDPARPEGPAKAIRSGRAELLPKVTERVLRAMSADEENLRMLQVLGLRSAIITPLVARGRILGAIAFASAESGRVFDTDDLALAEELTGRAAVMVDNARLYVKLSEAEQELRRSHVQLEAILGGVADSVTAQNADGRLIYANDAAARLLGLDSAEELIAADPRELMGRYDLIGGDGRPFPYDDLPGRRALRGEDPEPALVRYRSRATGDERWSQIKATAIRDESGEPVMAINVIEDVTDQREREDAQRFLADVGAALAGSLEIGVTFPHVARLAARQFAGWCAIELFEGGGEGEVSTIAFANADPDGAPHAEELMRRYPLPTYLTGPLTDGAPRLHAELSEERLAALARDPEHAALLRMLRPRSALTVPMNVRGRVLGAISLLTAESGRRLDEDDLLLAEVFAGRCALALDNARLYEERSRIARTLQESLLPPLLPDLPGLDVAARFRAAGAGIEVGGDFYDLFQLGDAGWAVAIGDVCGKGTGAAAITALARYTVRAAAMREEDPSQILALLNDALLTQRSDRRFATVLYGRLSGNGNGGGVSFEFSSGGHPLPLVLNGAGWRELGVPGTLLGVVRNPSLCDERVALHPGEAIVLYTDGVTDANAPERVFTPHDLAAAVGPTTGLSADAIAERMLRAAIGTAGGEPRDDIAIIVLKVPEAAAA
jgi:PAS domain S-box-containing protein